MKYARSILIILLILAVPSSFAAEKPETGKLFRHQYRISDPSFCSTEVCLDLDNDGRREISFASRSTKNLQMLNASDGRIIWSANIGRDSQSTCAYDLDEDGNFEIIYTTSSPGGMYVLDKSGMVLKLWNCDDWKLGNSPVIIDGDADGILDGYFGSRSKYLFRLNMQALAPIRQRDGWIQCGCHTSAMDVDQDGR